MIVRRQFRRKRTSTPWQKLSSTKSKLYENSILFNDTAKEPRWYDRSRRNHFPPLSWGILARLTRCSTRVQFVRKKSKLSWNRYWSKNKNSIQLKTLINADPTTVRRSCRLRRQSKLSTWADSTSPLETSTGHSSFKISSVVNNKYEQPQP